MAIFDLLLSIFDLLQAGVIPGADSHPIRTHRSWTSPDDS
jgi:hypothetical protein